MDPPRDHRWARLRADGLRAWMGDLGGPSRFEAGDHFGERNVSSLRIETNIATMYSFLLCCYTRVEMPVALHGFVLESVGLPRKKRPTEDLRTELEIDATCVGVRFRAWAIRS